MQDLSPRNIPPVSALPPASVSLAGVFLRLSSDGHPYYCDGTQWVDVLSNVSIGRPVRADSSNPLVVYQAWGPESAGDGDSVFSIRRLTRTGMTSVTAWSADNVAWSDRLSLVYS